MNEPAPAKRVLFVCFENSNRSQMAEAFARAIGEYGGEVVLATPIGLVLAGAVLIYTGVQLMKAGVDRPRPGGGLVDTEGSSFPSGHA